MNDAYYDRYWDELATDHSLYSVCCGCHPLGEVYTASDCDPTGICSKCRDHTTFERVDDEGNTVAEPKSREFTAKQLEIIKQLSQAGDEIYH